MGGEWKTDDDVKRPGTFKTMEKTDDDVIHGKNPMPREGGKPERPKAPEEKDKAPEVSAQQLKSALAKLSKAIDSDANPEFDYQGLKLLVAEKELGELAAMLITIDFKDERVQKELVPLLEGWGHHMKGGGMLFIEMEDEHIPHSDNEYRIAKRPVFDFGKLNLKGYMPSGFEQSERQTEITSLIEGIVYTHGTPEEAADTLAMINKIIKEAPAIEKNKLIAHTEYVYGNIIDDIIADGEQWRIAFDRNTGRFDFVTYDGIQKKFVKRKVSESGDQKKAEGILDDIDHLPTTPEKPEAPAAPPKTVAPNDEDTPGTPEKPTEPQLPKTVEPNDEDVPGTAAMPEKPEDKTRMTVEEGKARLNMHFETLQSILDSKGYDSENPDQQAVMKNINDIAGKLGPQKIGDFILSQDFHGEANGETFRLTYDGSKIYLVSKPREEATAPVQPEETKPTETPAPPKTVAPNDEDVPGTPVDPEKVSSLEEQAFDMAYEDAITDLNDRVAYRDAGLLQHLDRVIRLRRDGTISDSVATLGGLLGPTDLKTAEKMLDEANKAYNTAVEQRNKMKATFGKDGTRAGENITSKLAGIRTLRLQCGLEELPQNAATVLKLSKDERNAIANAPLDRGDPDYESVLAELRGGIQTLSRFQSILEMIDNGVGIAAGSIPGGGLLYSLSRNLTDVATGMKPPKKAAFDFCWGYIAGKIGSSIATRSGAIKFAEKWAENNAKLFTAKAGAAVDGIIGSLIEKGGQKILGDKI